MSGEWLEFITLAVNPDRRTHVWQVRNRKTGDNLGYIIWYAPWRQYILSPGGDTLWSASCLIESADFIRAQMEARNDV